MKSVYLISAVLLVVWPGAAIGVQSNTVDCGLKRSFTHQTRHYGPSDVFTDQSSLYFTTGMAVNTDGAPNSYHPDDPFGVKGLAINTICNGATAIVPGGGRIDYRRCKDLVIAFRAARAAGWKDPSKPRMDFYGVASTGYVPCISKAEAYSGYFVSTTSVVANPNAEICDQSRYLNSLEIPFAIYPNARNFTQRGVGTKDAVVYFNPANGAIDFGMIGDRGPTNGLGEGSVAFAKTLRKSSTNPVSRRDTYKFSVPKIHGLMLPDASIKAPFTPENVRKQAKEAFDQWGGEARLSACIKQLG